MSAEPSPPTPSRDHDEIEAGSQSRIAESEDEECAGNASDSDRTRESNSKAKELQANFVFLSILSKYYKRVFRELFLIGDASDKSSLIGSSTDCMVHYHRFGWLLFLALRNHGFSRVKDLVTCTTGLVSILAFLIIHVPTRFRKFDIHKSSQFVKKGDQVDLIASLCKLYETSEEELKNMVEKLNKLVSDVLKKESISASESQSENLAGIDPNGFIFMKELMDEALLSSFVMILEKDYEEVFQQKGELDERSFLKEDSLQASGSLSDTTITENTGTPVVGTIILSPEEEAVSFNKTASQEAKNAYQRIYSKCDVLVERGLDFDDLGDEVKDIFTRRQWLELAAKREGEINTTLVAEFYSVLSTLSQDELTESQTVPLRARNVTFNPDVINAILGVEVFPDNEDYRVVWSLDDPATFEQTALRAQHAFDSTAVWVENRFNYGKCFRGLRAIKRFISHNLYPSSKHTAYGKEDVCIAWAMVNDVKVDVGKVMFKRVFESIVIARPGSHLYFPCFISDLCRRSGVPFLPNDKLALADAPLIGPSLTRLPDGRISSLIRSRQTQPAPPVSTSSSFPSFSSQPQQTPFSNTITYDMFQSLVSDVARGQANMALFAESNRQWCDDIRRGLRRNEQLLRNPTFEDPAYPPCQSNPYTLPEWVTPIPPPSSIHPMSYPFGSQLSGTGVFSTGIQRPAMSSWGGFAEFAHITTGMSSSFHVDPEEDYEED